MVNRLSFYFFSLILVSVLTLSGCSKSTPPSAAPGVPTNIKHVVIVIEENHSYSDIIDNVKDAPYMNALVKQGALFTKSHAIQSGSQPNYLALFSGSTQDVLGSDCPNTYNVPNLGSELIAANDTFAGYSEGLPSVGFTGCKNGSYARKHNPWVNFTNVPASDNLPFKNFPSDYNKLPTVSFVVPNLDDQMHDGTVQDADTWLQKNLSPYISWAQKNNSLFILTWDESNKTDINEQIPTVFVGPTVKPGTYDENITHYNVLRTLEAIYHLPYAAESAKADPITDVWK